MMKKLKLIIFSLLLALWWLPMSHNAFAASLEANELSSAENISAMVSQNAPPPPRPNFCFQAGMREKVTIVVGHEGGEVVAYARAYPQRGTDGIDRQYLAIYHPSPDDIFHEPVSEEFSPKCDAPIRKLGTHRPENGEETGEVDLLWQNPKGVLLGGQTGVIECKEPLICGNYNWYYYRQ